ncbi:MAG: sigma-70 family RNA polymerase sigma factor [Magnetococcales bacterium]|nr:sigma-70 family RNA polymerase sigma factor [Magnetococcales bacterium]
MKESDLVLVEKTRQGNHRAFELLVRKYQGRVASAIGRMIHDPAKVQDLTQETFLKVYRSIEHFRGEASFFTWIYRIAVNTAKNHLQAHNRDLLMDGLPGGVEGNDFVPQLRDNNTPESQILHNELISTLHQAIHTLPDAMRQAVIMRDIEGLSYEEIAAKMSCPVGTVRSRIFRGRQEIVHHVKKYLKADTVSKGEMNP